MLLTLCFTCTAHTHTFKIPLFIALIRTISVPKEQYKNICPENHNKIQIKGSPNQVLLRALSSLLTNGNMKIKAYSLLAFYLREPIKISDALCFICLNVKQHNEEHAPSKGSFALWILTLCNAGDFLNLQSEEEAVLLPTFLGPVLAALETTSFFIKC